MIGSPVVDTIQRYNGTKVHTWGGITYSLLTFAKLANPEDRIFPVCKVGQEVWPAWQKLLQQFPQVDLRGVRVSTRTHQNQLLYVTPEERKEFFQPGDHRLSFQAFTEFLDAEAFYVNMLYPDDLTVETLRTLSYATTGWLFLDVHSWVRRLDPETGGFVLSPFPSWQQVVSYVDLLQMNMEELRAFAGMDIQDQKQEEAVVRWMLGMGPRVVLVTRGSGPILVGTRQGSHIRVFWQPVPSVPAKDPTGCGDVFGAAFFVEWVRTEDVDHALGRAVEIARLHALRTWLPETWLRITPG